jgi:hypothetical protein
MLRALNVDRGVLRLGGREVALTRRHTEVTVVLAAHPQGLTTEELALAVYGEQGKPATVRSELFRLRRVLGPWMRTDRDAVVLRVNADFLNVEALLRSGDPLKAAKGYPGPMVPRSESPGVVARRDELDAWLRRAVIATDDCEALWTWLESSAGREDLQVYKLFLANLSFDDPRRALAASRLSRLRAQLSVVPHPTQVQPLTGPRIAA